MLRAAALAPPAAVPAPGCAGGGLANDNRPKRGSNPPPGEDMCDADRGGVIPANGKSADNDATEAGNPPAAVEVGAAPGVMDGVDAAGDVGTVRISDSCRLSIRICSSAASYFRCNARSFSSRSASNEPVHDQAVLAGDSSPIRNGAAFTFVADLESTAPGTMPDAGGGDDNILASASTEATDVAPAAISRLRRSATAKL